MTASRAAIDLGWCSGATFYQPAKRRLDLRVDPDWLAKSFATVDDSMPDDVGVPQPGVKRAAQLAPVDGSPRRRQLAFGQRLVPRSEQR